jgi:type IV secretory pathway VirB10-like protein
LVLLFVIAIFTLIYMQTAGDSTRANSFYTSTSAALAQREAEERDGKALESDDVAVQQRLREAAEKARKSANEKAEKGYQPEVKKAAEEANVAAHVKGELKEAKAQEEVELRHKDVDMTKESGEKVLAKEGPAEEEIKAKEEADRKERQRREDKAKEMLDDLLKKYQRKFLTRFESLLTDYSHHILQVVLPVLSESQAYSLGPIHHKATATCC